MPWKCPHPESFFYNISLAAVILLIVAACGIFVATCRAFELQHAGSSSLTRDWTHPHPAAWSLSPRTTKEVPHTLKMLILLPGCRTLLVQVPAWPMNCHKFLSFDLSWSSLFFFFFFNNFLILFLDVLAFRCYTGFSIVVVNGGYSLVAVHGIPWWLSGKESACQCRRHGFHPWSRKMPQNIEACEPQLLSLCSRAWESQALSPCAAVAEAWVP